MPDGLSHGKPSAAMTRSTMAGMMDMRTLKTPVPYCTPPRTCRPVRLSRLLPALLLLAAAAAEAAPPGEEEAAAASLAWAATAAARAASAAAAPRKRGGSPGAAGSSVRDALDVSAAMEPPRALPQGRGGDMGGEWGEPRRSSPACVFRAPVPSPVAYLQAAPARAHGETAPHERHNRLLEQVEQGEDERRLRTHEHTLQLHGRQGAAGAAAATAAAAHHAPQRPEHALGLGRP